jgi:selenocysteine-specific elongation factor
VVCGALKTDETVWMLPDFAHRPLRVRALQCFGQAVPQVCAGDRASLNLMGLDRADYQRGQLISNFLLRPTQRIDARITLFAEAGQSLKRRGQVIFHAGTRMAVASTYLIDCDSLKGGESALVQLTLTMPFTLRADDRFILRISSDSRTLGGGVVLDITPLHHRKRTDKLRQALELLVQGRAIDRLANEVRKAFHALSCTALAERVNTTEDEIAGVLQGKLPADILKLDGRHAPVLYTRSHENQLRKQILSALGQFRVTHPLVEHGISYDELRSTLKVSEKADDEVLTHVLARLVEKQKVREVGRTWLLTNDVVEVGGSTAQAIDALLEHIAGSGVQVPLASELNAIARRFGLGEKELRQILAHLVTAGKLYRIEGEYVYATRVDEMRQILTAHLVSHPEGITVAGFRDLIDGNRKFCLLLFALFDQEKLTRREGDVRVLVQAPPSLVPFT